MIGAGWAGLAAAVEATARGHRVTLFEMAGQPGGRARQVPGDASHGAAQDHFDNGQHILIGAYTETLALMRRVGADPQRLLLRRPLCLAHADGSGLLLPTGPAVPAFVRAVLGQHRWPLKDRLALLRAAIGWRLRGFRCPPEMTVAQLTASLSTRLRDELIDPLCVAALNTPSEAASATVFLRILRDALFAGPGAADLLLPRERLSALLPAPAWAWLQAQGSSLRTKHRVERLAPPAAEGQRWQVDAELFDRVVIATTSTEAARLAADIAPAWSATASALRHEPITTLSLYSDGTRLSQPMLALRADTQTLPGQFVFDQGQLGGPPGLLTLVISGAAPWVERGSQATVAASIRQVIDQLGAQLAQPPRLVRLLTDKRATFRCTPELLRPAMAVADGLLAAGDYIAGPYPATLEGAVRSGLAAARAL